MIRIFADQAYLPKGLDHVEMLYPFWGKAPEDSRDPTSGRYDRYLKVGTDFFSMTSLPEAEIVVFPAKWEQAVGNQEAMELAWQLAEIAGKNRKPLVMFFWSDSAESVPIEDSVVLRTSLYRSSKKPNEFAMPAWSEDFVEKYLEGRISVRPKRTNPTVGFCGYAAPPKVSFRRKLRRILYPSAGFVSMKKSKSGAVIRAEAMDLLSRSSLVETNFIVRDRFLGGAHLPGGHVDLALLQDVQLEYVENMVESDYILCARGGGNFSYRLYETLCCGRIPVFIDTDCVLPYDFIIEWKKNCVWVDESELPLIAEKVAEFHSHLSSQEFANLQYECRRLWEQWLSPEGFFAKFYQHFL